MDDYPDRWDAQGGDNIALIPHYTQATFQRGCPLLHPPIVASRQAPNPSRSLRPRSRPVGACSLPLAHQQDRVDVYRYLVTQAKAQAIAGETVLGVRASLNRIAEECLRANYPNYKQPSLRKKVGQLLAELATCGVLTIVRSPQWKQVNTYILHPDEADPLGTVDPASVDPVDPKRITISRPDHELVNLNPERERENIDRDPAPPLSGERIEARTERISQWEVNVNSFTPQIHHSLPSSFTATSFAPPNPKPGSWHRQSVPFDSSHAYWESFEPGGIGFLHPDCEWFWEWMRAWTMKRRDRLLQSRGRNIARIDDYALTVIQSNGAHQWQCFQLAVAQWQQFANELDWAYVQNIAQFQEQLGMALGSPNHTTRLGAQWIIAHNPQWGVQVDNDHLAIAQDVQVALQYRLAPALQEWERLQWSPWDWQQALAQQFGTRQLSLLNDDQLGAWVAWLRVQSTTKKDSPTPPMTAPVVAPQPPVPVAAPVVRSESAPGSPNAWEQLAIPVTARANGAGKMGAPVARTTPAAKTSSPTGVSAPTVAIAQGQDSATPRVAAELAVAQTRQQVTTAPETTPQGATSRPQGIAPGQTVPPAGMTASSRTQDRPGTTPPPHRRQSGGQSGSIRPRLKPRPGTLTVPRQSAHRDLSDLLFDIDLLTEQLGWSPSQGRAELQRLFQCDRQSDLSDAQLWDWKEYLSEQVQQIAGAMQDCWNQHKPAQFAPLKVLTPERIDQICQVVRSLGGLEATVALMTSALRYAAASTYWQGRDIGFEIAMKHLVEWHEQNDKGITPTPCDPPYVGAFSQLPPDLQQRYWQQLGAEALQQLAGVQWEGGRR